MFIKDEPENVENQHKGVRIGSLAGKGYNIPDDFNEPLDDLKEYHETELKDTEEKFLAGSIEILDWQQAKKELR